MTTFSNGQWMATVPVKSSDEILLSASGIQPTVDLKGATTVWKADFSTANNVKGISINWRAGAAVYKTAANMIPANYNNLGVKPTHTNACLSPKTPCLNSSNSDHAGTPECEKTHLVAGAAGGGGSNFTGGWSATASAKLCP
jgi:hypothetical protein